MRRAFGSIPAIDQGGPHLAFEMWDAGILPLLAKTPAALAGLRLKPLVVLPILIEALVVRGQVRQNNSLELEHIRRSQLLVQNLAVP